MKKRLSPVLMILLLTIMLSQSFFEVTSAASRKKVIIIDIPRFDLAEVNQNYPQFAKLLSSSAAGLVTIPTIFQVQPAQVYLYLNSATYFKNPRSGVNIYDANEMVNHIKAGAIFENYTGNKAESFNAINIEMRKIIKMNPKTDLSNLGLIGSILHKKSIKTAAIGNTDTDRPSRYSSAMVMDQNGVIDFGAVGPETLKSDSHFPYGIRTDPDQILKYFRLFHNQADVIVVTLGDLERIESCRDNLSQSRKDYYRKQVLKRYDLLISGLIGDLDLNATLLMVFTCLQPEKMQIVNNTLTPVIIKGDDLQSGLLYSKYTHKKGLVTYDDIRNAIIKYINPGTKVSSIFTTIPGNWQTLIAEQNILVRNYSARWPLLTIYGVLMIGLLTLIVIGYIFHFSPGMLKLLAWSYLFLLTIPATFLLEALINPLHWVPVIILTLGIATAFFVGSYFAAGRDIFKTLSWISLFTFMLVLIDGLFGGYCESKSFLGYTAVSGKRYYGIGNEYMGILLGSYIVFIALNFGKIKRHPQRILWFLYVCICLVFFNPRCGANIGGGITAVLGLGIINHLWLKKPVRLKEASLLLLVLFLTLASVGVWDSLANHNSPTHFGQLLQTVGEKGANSFITIVQRKLEMNWRLIQYTPLTLVLIVILLIVPLIYKHPSAPVKRFISKNQEISMGFVGLNITAFIGFFANDSGIVAATTMFMFGLTMLLLTLIQEQAYSMADAGKNGNYQSIT